MSSRTLSRKPTPVRRIIRVKATAGLMAALSFVACSQETRIRVGADRLFDHPYREWIQGKRIGLITNHTGVDSSMSPLLERLDAGGFSVKAVFAPEHGLFGEAQAGEKVGSGGRVHSIYGERRSPAPSVLAEIDVLIYDIQDVETRFYTYISTLAECLRAAAASDIPLIVLDRPPPLGGHSVQGPVLEKPFASFVGIHELPIRYAMTAGELAGLFQQELELEVELRVVPLQGWKRGRRFEETGLSWVAPSPNMPTPTTASVYPGFCLIEGTNLSEGRGTTRPFEMFGAPWLDATALVGRLNSLGLEGVVFRAQSFMPTFSKYRGQNCTGVQVHVVDPDGFRPVLTALHVLSEVRALHPDRFEIDEGRFDRLAGNAWIRESLLKKEPVRNIVARWQDGLRAFERRRAQHLLY